MALHNAPAYSNGYQASDYGYISMNFDPANATNTTAAMNANGTLHVARIRLVRKALITNVILQLPTAGVGATLTSGRNFAALYNASGTLLSTTATQHTAWTSGGTKVMALSAAQTCEAGFYDVAFFSTGTTRPGFYQINVPAAAANQGLTTTNLRVATADTGLTTSMPNPMATKVATNAVAYWVAVS